MPKLSASRLGIYSDVREVADMALEHGGGEYSCASFGEAKNFSHRFYRFRVMYKEIYHSDGSACNYDKLILPRVTDEKIIFKVRKHVGTFIPAKQSSVFEGETDDELFSIAARIKQQFEEK